MKLIRILLVAIVAVLGATTVAQTAAGSSKPNYNDPKYWETRTEDPSVCYKHSGNHGHGKLVDGNKAVELNPYNPSWPGDHWELLVVKSGSVDANDGNGPGNAVYHNPTAGTKYYGPLNNGGQQGTVSHWIVCKGTTPEPPPVDLRLNLTAECAVGDTLYWRVTNDNAVDVPFSWDGPLSNDGNGVATAGTRTYFTTIDDGGANTTKITWTNPDPKGPSKNTKAHNNQPCVYHVSFDKTWDGAIAPDLDGATLLTASSSIGSATCTSDDGALSCTYTVNGASADDLHVPFGESYSVTENLPAGWYTVSGTGDGFTGIDGFETAALPNALVYDVADDRFCTSNPAAPSPKNLEKYCTHVVTNASTTMAPAPQFVDPTCAARDVAVVDPNPDDGITYDIVGTVAPGETVTVTAVAGSGVVLDGTTEWEHTFGTIDESDCVVQGTPSSSIQAECGAATLTFTNTVGELEPGFTGAPIVFSYTVDGEVETIEVAANTTETVELTFEEDSGVHTVAIGDGNPVLVESNCELDPVEPAVPQFVEPTCANPQGADVLLPSVDGVSYDIEGTVAPGETVTVTATAEPGFVLDGPAQWQHTFETVDPSDCVVQGTPSSSIEAECAAATLTFTNTVGELEPGFTGAPIEFTYTVDGVESTIEVAANTTETVELTFEEDSGVHTVAIGDGEPVLVESNCELDPVTPAVPQFVDPTCENPQGADVVLPSADGVSYSVTGTPAPGATVTVTATAEPGFLLDGPAQWQHTFATVDESECNPPPPPPEPSIEVAAFSPVCQADIPYIQYDVTVIGTDADRATLTFIDNTGKVIRTDTDLPLSGQIVYPGASPNPNPDWPGWKLNELGLWVPDPTDANWREGLTIRVDVNPTAEGTVTYPPATEVCNQPPTQSSGGPTTTVDSSGITPTPPPAAAQLPETGSDSHGVLVNLGLALMAVGAALAGVVRVRRPRPS